MPELRWYQQQAKDAVWEALRTRQDNPCVVLPTGSGKTPLLAALCSEAVENWNGKIMVVSHVKELLEQSAATLTNWYPNANVGIYSASLKQRNHWAQIVVAGIQTVYDKAFDFGERHLVIVDEAHLIPLSGDGMYQTFIGELKKANPRLRVIGLTATPYRTTSGKICRKNGVLNHICYQAPLVELMKQGFLCPLINSVCESADISAVAVRQGEFAAGDLEKAFDKSELVEKTCRDIVAKAGDRKSILVFAAGVQHGQHIAEALNKLGVDSRFLSGETSPLERTSYIANFKSGALRCLVNVNVLSTGFDATRVDCVAIVRATCSPGLFYQMCGRGFRLDPTKEICLILDYGGNLERHGSLDDPYYGERSKPESGTGPGEVPVKICPNCDEELPTSKRECECGFLFPLPSPKHDTQADTETAIIASLDPPEWQIVDKVEWAIHTKRGQPDAPRTLRVDYFVEGGNFPVSEWVCLEHTGYALQKAANWWLLRSSAPLPQSIEEALQWKKRLAIADTLRIQTQPDVKNPRFRRILQYELGEIPPEEDWQAIEDEPDAFNEEEVPF